CTTRVAVTGIRCPEVVQYLVGADATGIRKPEASAVPVGAGLPAMGCAAAPFSVRIAEFAMAIAVPLKEGAGPSLKQRLKHAERVNRWKAQALIAPLALFLLLVFLVPIAALLYKSVGNPEVVGGLPRTVEVISQ